MCDSMIIRSKFMTRVVMGCVCVCVCVYAYVLPVMRCLVHKWVWLHVDVDSICLDDMNMCTRVCAQVGLGLGAWCVVAPLQTKLNVHTVLNILAKVCICVFGGGHDPLAHPHGAHISHSRKACP